MKQHPLPVLAAALALAVAAAVRAEETTRIEEVVVTAPMVSEPLTVVTNPKAPRQPVPAHDGADYLKNIPGFSAIRKGGTDGDPVLRGLAGSRLNVQMDGQNILGGCGMRMDPPTAYVFPEVYDRITVLKGPQTVLHGGGNLAGTALFERDTKRFDAPATRGFVSALAGSFDRNDLMADVTGGGPGGYVRAIATRTDANDYEDGAGRRVHSAYTRWSGSLLGGWTPDAHTRLELSVDRSDGEAAYADRMMDGTLFDRTSIGVRLEKTKLSALVEKLEVQAFHHYSAACASTRSTCGTRRPRAPARWRATPTAPGAGSCVTNTTSNPGSRATSASGTPSARRTGGSAAPTTTSTSTRRRPRSSTPA